jgi:transmembrane sensor
MSGLAVIQQLEIDALRQYARELIMRLASGDITDDEMTALRVWIAATPQHRAAFDLERVSWRALAPLHASLEASTATSCVPMTVRGSPPTVTSSSRRRVGWGLAVAMAACLTILIGAGDILAWLRADYVTAVGEVAGFRLPDGSVAILNTNSALAVHFDGTERRIDLLRGEAWFRVRKDVSHPFRVHAREGVAEAVGTAFGVRNDNDDVTVSVTEGVVAVTSPQHSGVSKSQTVQVSAGLQSAYAPGRNPNNATVFDVGTTLAWRRRHIVIEDRPFREAIVELNRYRRGRIILMDHAFDDVHVSAVFAVNELDQGLLGLATTQGLSVTYVTPYLVFLR